VQATKSRSRRPRRIWLIKCTQPEIGLSYEFCEAVVGEKDISPAIKSAVLDYYTEVFVDSEPFRSILKHPMTCIDHSKLDQIPVTARIYSMINIHDSEEPDENEEILDRINGFHNLTLIAIKQAFSWFPRRYAEHKTDGRQAGVGKELEINEITMTTNLDQSCNVLSFLLDYQTSVLMLIKMQVILGLADSSLIKSAIECTGLVLKIDHEKIPNIEKSSILFFFKYCRRKPSLKQSFQKLIAQSLDLLQTLIAIRRHYQVISFLKLWSISEKLEKIDDSTWTEMIIEVFSIFSLTAENKNDQKLLNLNSMNKNFVQIVEDIFPEESGTRKASIVSGDLSFEVNPTDEIKRFRKDLKGILHQRMPVDLILVENLFKDQASNENVNYQPTYNARQDANFIQEKAFQIDFKMRICNTIMSNLDQALQVFHILNMIVIFQGLYQKKIYRTLTFDTHSKHELINDKLNESVPLSEKDINSPSPETSPPEPIAAIETEPQNQISIHYLEKELLNLKRKRAILDPKDPGARLQIDQAQDEVQKIIISLADYLQESYKLKLQFTKTQNLMRNLGFGSVVISIIEDQNNHSLIPMCLKFLHYFSYMNTQESGSSSTSFRAASYQSSASSNNREAYRQSCK
jgi:hypothetical protein